MEQFFPVAETLFLHCSLVTVGFKVQMCRFFKEFKTFSVVYFTWGWGWARFNVPLNTV